MAAFFLFGTFDFAIQIWRPMSPAFAQIPGLLWYLVFCMLFMLGVTLAALWAFLHPGEIPSLFLTAANVLLMLCFPFGTFLGLYYFRKVRRQLPPHSGDESTPAVIS